jgi:ABC-type antimicrobial peptide transport system permease subunit
MGDPVPVQLAGDAGDSDRAFRAARTHVGERYFHTLGVPVIEGREFDERDRPNSPRVAVVNEALARRLWPAGRAAGNRVTIDGASVEVVGVVKNFDFVRTFEAPPPIAYLNFWQRDASENWSHDSRTHVRVTGDAATLLPTILQTIAAVDADVPVSEAQTLRARLDFAFTDVRAARALLAAFGILGLALSTIGLYAALAFAVGHRAREIAIRVALGAGRIDVGRLVLGHGAAIVLVGVAIGLTAALIAGPLLAHLLYGVSARDPLTLLAGPSLLIAVALVAMALPTRRAMRLDPIAVLRFE